MFKCLFSINVLIDSLKVLVDTFNKEKSLVGAFYRHCENLTALLATAAGVVG